MKQFVTKAGVKFLNIKELNTVLLKSKAEIPADSEFNDLRKEFEDALASNDKKVKRAVIYKYIDMAPEEKKAATDRKLKEKVKNAKVALKEDVKTSTTTVINGIDIIDNKDAKLSNRINISREGSNSVPYVTAAIANSMSTKFFFIGALIGLIVTVIAAIVRKIIKRKMDNR